MKKFLPDRIARQKRLIEAMRRQLSFEILVLERLESRVARCEPAEPETRPAVKLSRTLTDVLEGARERARAAQGEERR